MRPVIALLAAAMILPLHAAPAAAAETTPEVVAHRGGAAYAPENTMLAVENAVRLGVDAIEVDVVFSADEQLVIIHDDTLERTTDCTGLVGEHTVAELQECDAAHWFTPGENVTTPDGDGPYPLRGAGITVPTLAELFAYTAGLADPPVLYVEVKTIPGEDSFDPIARDYAEEVLRLAEEHDVTDQTVVLSFWPAVLEHIKLLDPDVPTLLLTTSELGFTATMNLSYVIARGHDIAGPDFRAPDFGAEFVEGAHAAGKRVGTWTVNTEEDLRAVADIGPDAIISDFPACLLDILGRDRPDDVLPPELTDAGVVLPACTGGGQGEPAPDDDESEEPGEPEDSGEAEADPSPDPNLPATGGGVGAGLLLLAAGALARRVRA
jgi:glycerophosphoryl diester phosphodiesterase